MDESNIPLPSTPLPVSSDHPTPPAPANLPTAPKSANIFGISLSKPEDVPSGPAKPTVPPPWTIPHEQRVAGPVMPPKPRPPEPAIADYKLPHHRRASYGALVSIIIILLIVIVGAFYAWGARIAEERVSATPDTSAQQ